MRPPGWKPQRQDALDEQLADLLDIARREGMYDAHDFLFRILVDNSRRATAERDLRQQRLRPVTCPNCGAAVRYGSEHARGEGERDMTWACEDATERAAWSPYQEDRWEPR